jgi:hypothetical protein
MAILMSLAIWPASMEAVENLVHLLGSGTFAHFQHQDDADHHHHGEGEGHDHENGGDHPHHVMNEPPAKHDGIVAMAMADQFHTHSENDEAPSHHHDGEDHQESLEHDCSATAHLCDCCASMTPLVSGIRAWELSSLPSFFDADIEGARDLFPRDFEQMLLRPPIG